MPPRDLLRDIAGVVRSGVWLLDGSEPNSGKPLRVLFAGGEQQKEYVAALVFNGKYRQTYAGKLYLPQLHRMLLCNTSSCDLAFIEGHRTHRRLYMGPKDYYTPLWLESCVDLPLKAPSKGAKEDLRRIRKNKLACELSKDMESVKDFYENMYLPTIQDRHEATGVRAGPDAFEAILRKPDNTLMLIKHGEVTIAGVVIQIRETPRLWVAGIRDSSNTYRRMGAVGATYHFPAQYLSGLGYRKMGLGRSRSFLHDGVVRYKSKWGHRFYDFDTDGMIIKLLTVTESLSGFLTNQPFVSVCDGQLHANVFIDVQHPPSERRSEEIEVLRSESGLSGVRVFSLDTIRGSVCELNGTQLDRARFDPALHTT